MPPPALLKILPAIAARGCDELWLNPGTESESVLAEAQRLSPDGRFSSLGRLKAALGYWGVPKVRALFEATYFAGLRKAGMSEE